MTLAVVLSLCLGLLPVLVFLLILVLLDSYKLVPWRRVLWQLVLGAVAAAGCLLVDAVLQQALGLPPVARARYLAPVIEELLKGAAVIVLLVNRRFGFLVDAAIAGFALGAGFAATENLRYFWVLRDTSLVLWMIRGFGTAVMHGSVTAIMAVTSKQLSDRRGGPGLAAIAPGWGLAIVLHSAFNHFFLSPNASTALLLLLLPGFFLAVFSVSETRTREWLGTGFDTDQELLHLINEGRASDSRIGTYLGELKQRFSGTVVADMLCLLRIRLELSIRAKGILIMRKAGFKAVPDHDFNERVAEVHFLEHAIGPTALRALSPILNLRDRDFWQVQLLHEG